MDEYIKNWLIMMHKGEIEASKASISNEHLWEFGYELSKYGNETEELHGYNPHTENIRRLNKYIELLENYIKELEG